MARRKQSLMDRAENFGGGIGSTIGSIFGLGPPPQTNYDPLGSVHSPSDPKYMSLSPTGAQFIQGWEKFKPNVYDDGKGNPTIGYGHLLNSWKHDPITQQEAQKLFEQDVPKYQSQVQKNITAPLSQGQFDALTDLTFNLGSLPGSVANLVNDGDYSNAVDKMGEFNRARNRATGDKDFMQGLANRREADASLFNGTYQEPPNVAGVQQRLQMAGFDPGPVDGRMGPQTQAALDARREANVANARLGPRAPLSGPPNLQAGYSPNIPVSPAGSAPLGPVTPGLGPPPPNIGNAPVSSVQAGPPLAPPPGVSVSNPSAISPGPVMDSVDKMRAVTSGLGAPPAQGGVPSLPPMAQNNSPTFARPTPPPSSSPLPMGAQRMSPVQAPPPMTGVAPPMSMMGTMAGGTSPIPHELAPPPNQVASFPGKEQDDIAITGDIWGPELSGIVPNNLTPKDVINTNLPTRTPPTPMLGPPTITPKPVMTTPVGPPAGPFVDQTMAMGGPPSVPLPDLTAQAPAPPPVAAPPQYTVLGRVGQKDDTKTTKTKVPLGVKLAGTGVGLLAGGIPGAAAGYLGTVGLGHLAGLRNQGGMIGGAFNSGGHGGYGGWNGGGWGGWGGNGNYGGAGGWNINQGIGGAYRNR